MLVNKTYWEDYYKSDGGREDASPFAHYCLPKIAPGFLMEIGAGLGHDCALFMSRGDIFPLAIEQSKSAILLLKQQKIPFWFPGDVLDLPQELFDDYETVYSRFSLHCFTDEEQEEIINRAAKWLKVGGLFCIECRSVKDELYGKGEQVGRNAFINGHYRNFVVKEELEQELKRNGFEIVESVESNGLAKYKNEDPIVIRVIARKVC